MMMMAVKFLEFFLRSNAKPLQDLEMLGSSSHLSITPTITTTG